MIKKISQLPDSPTRDLLLASQYLGEEMMPNSGFAGATLIGLARILTETGIVNRRQIRLLRENLERDRDE